MDLTMNTGQSPVNHPLYLMPETDIQKGVQGMFLRAGRPDVALQMRQDLRHWGAALRLAERSAPQQAIHIKQHHAEALEMQGDVGTALQYFQVGSAAFQLYKCNPTFCRCDAAASLHPGSAESP